MTAAARNRQIKKTLEQAFGRGKVRVRGSRGTAYGWVSVHITYSPRNIREQQELRTQVMALLNTAKIEIGTYGYDDPGSDYGYGKTITSTSIPAASKPTITSRTDGGTNLTAPSGTKSPG